jgi:predicted transcriptional regulator of viral defense system
MILHKRESEVLEALRQKRTLRQMEKELHISPNTITKIIHRLTEYAAIERVGLGHYVILVDKYEISPTRKVLTQEQQTIVKFYGKETRTQLAKRMNVNKFTLNTMIIELGLGS